MFKIFLSSIRLLFTQSAVLRGFYYKIKYKNCEINYTSDINIANSAISTISSNCSIGKFSIISVGDKNRLFIGKNTYIGRNVEIGAVNIFIGDAVTIQDRCIILGNITIGANSILAPNVYISSGTHFFSTVPSLPIKLQDKFDISEVERKQGYVKIEEDCWIGINTVILRNITIGKGSIIGANSLVNKDIPPYSIAMGSPAKVVKKRLVFSPPSEIFCDNITNMPYFYSGFNYTYEKQIPDCKIRSSIFSLALKTENAKIVDLEIDAKFIGNREIIYNNQLVKLKNGLNNIQFNIINYDLEFKIIEFNSKDIIRIRKAKVL